MPIPVIDLFAGPGGLGEGFSSVFDSQNERVFDIKLSIEKDENAHQTLELRSFTRQFPVGNLPEEYYELMREPKLAKRAILRQQLFEKYPEQAAIAKEEAWLAELGNLNFPSKLVDKRIKAQLDGTRNWVLIGGPPCQAYSLVGRSRRQEKEELNKDDHRVFLYKEYLRIIAVHQPAVFVMENVKGLLSAKLGTEKVFDLILNDLKNPSIAFPKTKSQRYRIYSLTTESDSEDKEGNPVYKNDRDYLIQAEKYGVPQRRHRVILLGVRADIDAKPDILKEHDQEIALKDVIGDLPKLRSAISKSYRESYFDGEKKRRKYDAVKDSTVEWKQRVQDFRKEIVSWNGFKKSVQKSKFTPVYDTGSEFIPFDTPSKTNPLYEWYHDERIGGVCNHESRAHLLQDLLRYQFSSVFTEKYNRSPKLSEFAAHSQELMPDHDNAATGKFEDRFKTQEKNSPATTVTCHISKDGHYFIHYDTEQCRSWTVREAARVQTFPDNYLFCGSRTAQFHQVGNAVPPFLAKQIGIIVFDMLN